MKLVNKKQYFLMFVASFCIVASVFAKKLPSGGECNGNVCTGGETKCCTDTEGSTWYNGAHPDD